MMAVFSIEAKMMATFLILMSIVLAVDGDDPGSEQPNLKTYDTFCYR